MQSLNLICYNSHQNVGQDGILPYNFLNLHKVVNIMRRAEKENWTHTQNAKAMELDEEQVPEWLESWERARGIVNAANPSESFRKGVMYSIIYALREGLSAENDETIADLVIQICYRAADLGYLLDREGSRLSDYSEWLR